MIPDCPVQILPDSLFKSSGIRKGYTRVELARRVNISPSYVYRIEKTTDRTISYPLLKRLAQELGTDILALIGDELPDEKQTTDDLPSAEDILLRHDVTVAGRKLDPVEKITLSSIMTIMASNNLTRAKKLEHVLSVLY